MCLTFFCRRPQVSPQTQFVIGFNREEQTTRSTLQFNQYKEDPNIYGGRDLISGGTWLGLNISTGLLVILTNYDLPYKRYGQSRGKLVYSFLSSSFIPKQRRNQTDTIVLQKLKEVAKIGKQYSAFNLIIYNIRTQKTHYMCSEWEKDNPIELLPNKSYGICNCDINTIWPKTEHGLKMFENIKSKLDHLNEEDILKQLGTLFKDNVRFSEIDDDQASIFVKPYWCTGQKAERMTKSTFLMLITVKQGKKEIIIKQITYSGIEAHESEVNFKLQLSE